MARRKHITSSGGSAPWLNTFADLMNLLLCFFVMLFAFSDINIEKFNKVSMSMANSFGITNDKSGTTATGLIDSGMSQITGLDQYYSEFGAANNDSGATGNAEVDNANTTIQNADGTGQIQIDEALAQINKEMAVETAKMYDEVSDLAIQYNLSDYVELSADPGNKYVLLTLKGSVLYDSGEAEVKKRSLMILSNIGNILKKFEGYGIEIIGYTDNVPITDSTTYKNNNWLSSARALNAAEYLIDECGIDASILKYSGRGEYEPISSNATEDGRAKNRRIEFKIYNQYSSE